MSFDKRHASIASDAPRHKTLPSCQAIHHAKKFAKPSFFNFMKTYSILVLALASLFSHSFGQEPFFVGEAVRATRDSFVYQSTVSNAPIVATARSGENAVVTQVFQAPRDIRTAYNAISNPLVWWVYIRLERTPALSGAMPTTDEYFPTEPAIAATSPTGSLPFPNWSPATLITEPDTTITLTIAPVLSHGIRFDYITAVRISGETEWIACGGTQAPEYSPSRTYNRFFQLPSVLWENISGSRAIDLRTAIAYLGEELASSTVSGAFVIGTVVPSFTELPANQLLAVGDSMNLTCSVTAGCGLSLEWLKDGTAIPTATGTALSVPQTKLSDGGTYTVKGSYPAGMISATAEVCIVAATIKQMSVTRGQAIALVGAQGVADSFTWEKDGIRVKNGSDFTGAESGSLTITAANPDPTGVYNLTVSGAGKTIVGGDFTVTLASSPPHTPTLLPQVFEQSMIGKAFTHQIEFAEDQPGGLPSSFSAKGLPAGFKLNPTTGVITGEPKSAGKYQVTLAASNAAGVSAPIIVRLEIQPVLPSLIGSWIGVLGIGQAEGAVGGRIDLSVAASGMFTGKLLIGATAFAFTGKLNTTEIFDLGFAHAAVAIVRPAPMSRLTLQIDFDTTTSTISGSLNDDTESLPLSLNGWRNTWNKNHQATSHSGVHSFATINPISVEDDKDIPLGSCFGTIAVNAATGATTVSGRVADDTASTPILCTGFLGPNGEVICYNARYYGYCASLKRNSVNGCLLSEMVIAADSHIIESSLTWKKGRQTRETRAYPNGFTVETAVHGGKYAPPVKGSRLFGMLNDSDFVYFTCAGADLADSVSDPSITVSVTAANQIIVPSKASGLNPCNTLLKITASSGSMSGSFKLGDPLPGGRQVSFTGVLVNSPEGGQTGYGFFMMPKLPEMGQKITTSPLQSGPVLITSW